MFKDNGVDWMGESPIWKKVPGAEPEEDGFNLVIRAALQARVEGIEPAPTTWDTVRRHIEALVPPLSEQGEVCIRRGRDV
jgi:hypothetical protein